MKTTAEIRNQKAACEFLPVERFWVAKPAGRKLERAFCAGVIAGTLLTLATALLFSSPWLK